MNFSLERACDASTRVEHASAIGNVEAWPHVDLGLDRVYTQPGTSGAHSDAAAAYLRVGRELFFSLTGSPPPAIAIAFVRDRNLGGTQDEGGREVWPVNESQLEDDEGLLVVIHEWTHAVFAQSLRFTGNSSSRYLEDGVCETVSHLVYARVHGTQRSPVAKTRAAELARAREPAFDLVSLDGRIASSTGATLFDQLASICSNSLITIGYGLGMALWLERLDADPQALSSLFAQLRARGQPRADDLIELAEQAAGKDGVRRASVARALTILRAHASGAD